MGELNFQNVFDKVRKDSVMVHCITNYVTINDVANIILAMGASPIMADAENMQICAKRRLPIHIPTARHFWAFAAK